MRSLSLPVAAVLAALPRRLRTDPGTPAGPAPPPPASSFRAADFAWSQAPGRNVLTGHMSFGQSPARYTCAGATVILTPETPWTRQRMTILYASAERAALPTDEVRARTPNAPAGDYSAYLRRTTCDAGDRFSFSGLPDGAWFVITLAKPAAGPGPSIALMRRVVTAKGRVVPFEL